MGVFGERNDRASGALTAEGFFANAFGGRRRKAKGG